MCACSQKDEIEYHASCTCAGAGVAPETCVRWLCGRGIDYNFGEITEFTRQMTLIFKAEYDGSQVTRQNFRNWCMHGRDDAIVKVYP